MQIYHQKDFGSGLLLLVTGLAFGWAARNYDMGMSRQMGPGYFPIILSVILALIGLCLCLRSIRYGKHSDSRIGRWGLKPMFFIIGANTVFGIMLAGLPALGIPALGFVPAVVALVILAGMGGENFEWRIYVPLAIALAILSYIIFIYLLGMQFSAFPAFFGEAQS